MYSLFVQVLCIPTHITSFVSYILSRMSSLSTRVKNIYINIYIKIDVKQFQLSNTLCHNLLRTNSFQRMYIYLSSKYFLNYVCCLDWLQHIH